MAVNLAFKSRPNPEIKPPTHLKAHGKRLWTALQSEYNIADPAGLVLLRKACELEDEITAMASAIATKGSTFKDRFGQPRPHPLLAALRDNRAQQLATLKALNLDLEPLHDRPGRP